MRLAPLLAALPDDQLDRLAGEHVHTDEKPRRAQLCSLLEGVLRSYRFVHDFLINRQPPTFALLTLLLDAPGFQLPREGFAERVMAETRRLTGLIDSGELLTREEQLRLYRRALYEARRNDLDINTSEAALLALLRREGGISQVDHFLVEHHRELREFWDKDDAYVHEETALSSAGIIFIGEENVLVPEDVAPAIWQTFGIDMPSDSARRLFGYLSSGDLAAALDSVGAHTSGSKEARLERILLERIQPRAVLRSVDLPTLRDICRATEASVGGNKDELIERVIDHFAQRKDQREEPRPEPPRIEPRRLDQGRFETLFSVLLHQELSDILRRFPELRQSGTKDARIRTLWDAHLAEHTFLAELMSRDLENILHRLGLRLSGSKSDRVERIIDHFADKLSDVRTSSDLVGTQSAVVVARAALAADVLAHQDSFKQKASNPQASLQPWLESLFGAPGLVRCYATEDANPTKQLKNKLSQAVAARNGLLILMLADQSSFDKAREALLGRWMTNAEWPKSVACVALACPLAAPAIKAIVQRCDSPWPEKIQRALFPDAEVVSVQDETGAEALAASCRRCGQHLPTVAKFCPNCGASVSSSH